MPIATDDEHADALRVCMIDDEPKEPGIVELV
jgi:hypothetical protein